MLAKSKRDVKKFGDNIRKYRQDKNLTIEEFAFRIGVNARLIYDYENSMKKPSLGTLLIIANTLDVTLDSLFE